MGLIFGAEMRVLESSEGTPRNMSQLRVRGCPGGTWSPGSASLSPGYIALPKGRALSRRAKGSRSPPFLFPSNNR